MNMPGINISFTEKAATAIQRGERGVIAMIIKGMVPATNPLEILSAADIPSTFSVANKKQIENALKGYINTPKKVIVYCLGSSAEDYSEALDALELVKFNYLVAPSCETDEQTSTIASWVGAKREDGKKIKAILPNSASDKEYIINYTTESVTDEDGTAYTAEQYCSRIAGIIAGTPLSISCTYAPLAEIADCTRLKKTEMDAAVAAGKLFAFHDGEKVKLARGITSLTTTTEEKGEQFQKIKIVDAMDMITDDITKTVEDNYIGKYANSYNNKCVLISAISNYFESLRKSGILSGYSVKIDIAKNKEWLDSHGYKTAEMTDDKIKQADTGDKVFLLASVKILDAIEEVTLPISI